MGHPQPATAMQTEGIVNDCIKQCQSKAINMHFYWVCDCVCQGHFQIHWKKGSKNLADYFTKHHALAHHKLMHPAYLHTIAPNISPSTSWGCVDDNLHDIKSYHLSNSPSRSQMGTGENPVWHCSMYTKYIGNVSWADKAIYQPSQREYCLGSNTNTWHYRQRP